MKFSFIYALVISIVFSVDYAHTQSLTEQQGSATKQGSDTKEVLSDGEQGSSTTNELDEAYERFVKLGQELGRNKQLINKFVVSMPVGFPEQRRQQQAKIDQLEARNRQIYSELLPTAQESFQKFPNTKEPINSYLKQYLSFQLSGKNWRHVSFNPVAAARTFKELKEGGIASADLSLLGYRTHYLLNDFEQSRLLLIEESRAGIPQTRC